VKNAGVKDVRMYFAPGTSGRANPSLPIDEGLRQCPRNRQSGIQRACFNRPAAQNAAGPVKIWRGTASAVVWRDNEAQHVHLDDPFDADRELTRSACVCPASIAPLPNRSCRAGLRCEPVAVSGGNATRRRRIGG